MENVYKTLAAAVGTVMSIVAGVPVFVWALLGAMTLDFVTGVACAWMGKSNKTAGGGVSSTVARQGAVRKGMMIVVVCLAALLDWTVANSSGMVSFSAVTGTTCFWFIASEGISILENAAEMGVPVPKALTNTLESMKSRGEEPEKKE